LESWTTTYAERVEGVLRDLDRMEKRFDKLESQIAEEARQVTRVERDLQHAEREIEKLRSSRFDIGKLILAAILGGAVAFGFSFLNDYIKAARVEHPVRKASP
jgi:septal ring factor EnvC (AmiA/AmiB activator)